MESFKDEKFDDCLMANGLSSYENPNYHLGSLERKKEDSAMLKDIEDKSYYLNNMKTVTDNRRGYASMCFTEMGVNLHGPVTDNNSANNENYRNFFNGQRDKNMIDNVNAKIAESCNVISKGTLDITTNTSTSTPRHSNKPDLIESADNITAKEIMNDKPTPPSSLLISKQGSPLYKGNVDYITNHLEKDYYAMSICNDKIKKECNEDKSQSPIKSEEKKDEQVSLPPGWEKHEDEDGPYYWHIKSGTIRREPPDSNCTGKNEPKTPIVHDVESMLSSFHEAEMNKAIHGLSRSKTTSEIDNKKIRNDEYALKRRSFPINFDFDGKEKGVRFAVRSLGWLEVHEDDLMGDRSSKIVNRCITELSGGRNDISDSVGRWGDGKELYMDMDEGALKLIDPITLAVLNSQPIHTIRVWGVGRDNGRDFAYVARDRVTRKHMCHVFRCDIHARTIANTLRDICKKIMIERSMQQNALKQLDGSCKQFNVAMRPNNLPIEHRRHHRNSHPIINQSFPTPMEEPRKIMKALYLGSLQVQKATGMDTLNDAVDVLVMEKTKDDWEVVNVIIAPSMITIQSIKDTKFVIENRVRYLSFLGIGKDVRFCAFIMHTAQDQYVAHAFYCEPSSGALCKTVEAACKLRYQKCLDAHPDGLPPKNTSDITPGKSIGATIKSFVGSFSSRKMKLTNS